MDYQKKIKTLEELKNIVEKLKKNGEKIVTTNGCFDLIHPGHIKYLWQAKKYGDILIVGLNSDTSIKKIKGNQRPILKEKARSLILASLSMIDYIVIFSEVTPIKLLKTLKPNIHIKGGDYIAEKIIEYETVKKFGGEVKIIQFIKGYSTTNLIKKIKKIEIIEKPVFNKKIRNPNIEKRNKFE
ncbi:MAG: D-glycero-beta-D-manno-heptose 1-phosphate adenylyltransferase [bacterium]